MLPVDDEGYVQTFRSNENDAIIDSLRRYGVVVIRDVLDVEECRISIDAVWEQPELESRGVRRHDPGTWHRCWPRDGSIERKGWIGSSDVIFCKQAWKNRFNHKVQEVFHTLWRSIRDPHVQLQLKLDRFGVMRPLLRPEWKTDQGWLHTDQNPAEEPEFIRLQGVITFTDSTHTGGGFECVPGFHREWTQYCERNSTLNEDVAPVPDSEIEALRGRSQKITARAGSLIVWDSRLPHANYPNVSTTQFRMVQYVTYYPNDLDTERRFRNRKNQASAIRDIMLKRDYEFDRQQYYLMGGRTED